MRKRGGPVFTIKAIYEDTVSCQWTCTATTLTAFGGAGLLVAEDAVAPVFMGRDSFV